MSLSKGQHLGPYAIVSQIGAGGMGEVYRARDTRLERTVAIKILPPELSSNPSLKQRFEREARTISNLSHPHICTLHDVGHKDGIDYLVMEYLEGQTLAERLNKGVLPIEEVLRYALGGRCFSVLVSGRNRGRLLCRALVVRCIRSKPLDSQAGPFSGQCE